MDDTLKLGFSQAQAADRRRMYRTVLGLVLALQVLLAVLYVPGWMDPLRARWPNLAGILGRLGLGLVYLALGGGFTALGIVELALALLLAWLYLSLLKAELMSRP